MSSLSRTKAVVARYPGDLLVSPVPLASICTIVLNDRVLKSRFPSAATGKISDFAGLIFFPLLVVSALELCRYVGHVPTWQLSRRTLAIVIVSVGVVFTSIKLVAPIGDVYAPALGTAQYPFRIVLAWILHRPPPGWHQVSLTRDTTDLIALPMLAVAWRLGSKRLPSR
jgi:hypothetical protein